MKIAIIDDLDADRALLSDYSNRYWTEQKNSRAPIVSLFPCGGSFLATLADTRYDLVLLDCNMDDCNGLQVAERLRECDRLAVLVFVTVSRDYAVDGYRVSALDYLVKPVSYDSFVRMMEHIRPCLPLRRESVTVPAVPHSVTLHVGAILFCDTDGHYTQFHLSGLPLLRARMTFSQVQELLSPYPQFLLCYRGCLINMEYIRKMEEMNFLLLDGSRVPFRKKGRSALLKQYSDYLFSKVRSDA